MKKLRHTDNRMGALSWVLILAFLLTSLGQVNGVVLAQDEVPTETPAVTEETPTSEVTEAPAIPAEPTDGGVSAQSDLPNLHFFNFPGWDAAVILSSHTGAGTSGPLYIDQPVYVKIGFGNSGPEIPNEFKYCLTIDDTTYNCWSLTHLNSGAAMDVEDWEFQPSVSNGIHTVKVELDPENVVEESNEQDNVWTATMVWGQSIPGGPAANDLIPNAIEIQLDTVYQASSTDATISLPSDGDELADPVNVCNTGDTYSLWYEFTAPSDGIYIVNTYGSDRTNSRNITVLEKVSNASRNPVVCGQTNLYHANYEDYFKVAFNATEDTTYLIGISGTYNSDSISLQLQQYVCVMGHLCGAGVNGDGSVMKSPSIEIFDKNYSTDIEGYSEGEYFGLIDFYSKSISEGPYEGPFIVVTSSNKTFLISQGVQLDGYFTPTAIDLPKTTINVLDTSGEEVYVWGVMLVSRDHTSIRAAMDSVNALGTINLYVSPGFYDISVISQDSLMYIDQPDIEITSSTENNSFIFDASELPFDTFTFDLDQVETAAGYVVLPKNWSWYLNISDGDSIIFAAPVGTVTKGVGIQLQIESEGKKWLYESKLVDSVEIVGGVDHNYSVGGAITLNPNIVDQPYLLEDGIGKVTYGVVDLYNNPISSIYYYDNSNYEYVDVFPSYSVKDATGSVVSTGSLGHWLLSETNFSFPTSGIPGTWTFEETMDFGPLGGLQTASATFTVDSLANHPVVNDDFDSATVIDSMPFSLEGYSTRGSTSTSDDPKLEGMPSDWWGNSVWFKYTPAQSGILTLDTIGQNYSTLLSVWKGSRGSLSYVTANDNYIDPVTGKTQPYSQVSFPVTAGQTYYIMVQGFVGFGSEGYGKLNLHGSLAANPNCYSLSVSSNSTTYGTVQVLTAPNCGTQYSEGTKVLLSAVAKPGYGFYNWSDSNTDDPYTLTINANTTLKANFVKMVAPVITSPAAGALINDASPSFTWGDTQFADTYQIQIDSQSSFTLPIDQDETVDTLTYESPALSPDGVKYYRVRAINAYGDAGPWSAVRSFTLDTLPPAAPTLTAPADSAWIVGVPTYTWSAVVEANAYRFEYDTDADFAHAVASAMLSSTSYKPLEQTPGTYYWRVWARDAAGNWSVSPSTVSTVTVLAAVPPAPKITPFENGPLTNSATPTINWGAVYFADSYTLQISSSATFAALLVNETVDADTLSYVFSAPNDGDFFARVQAKNASGESSPWSGVYKFTVDTVAPAVPTLLSPIGESYTGTTIPKLTLAAVSTAKTYEYQVDDAPTFETPVLSVSSSSTGYSTTAAQALPLGLLYWRARAVDAAGNPSDWSAPQSFYQTNQRTPNTTTVVTVATPTFTWSTLAGATEYRLLVCQNEEMTECVIDATLGNVTKYVSPNPFSPAVYYWQIKVVGGVFDGKSTLPIQFSVSPVIPAAPKPSYPANGAAIYDKTPGLSWTSVLNAVSYEIQINNATNFVAVGLDLTTAESWIEASSLADGKYFWRVRAIDANGAFSKWSSIYTFTIDTVKPDAPNLVSPGTNDVLSNQLPKLTVTKVIDATLYEYQASASPDFSFVILDKTINSTSYTLVSGQQLPLGKIYWRARVLDAAINASDWSEVDSFWVTNQKTPADESFTTSAQPQFTWTTVPNGGYYFLKVCKDPDLSTCVVEVNYLTVTGYKPTTPLDLGKYYWQIKVQSIDGIELMTSPILSFTVTSPSLAAPVLLGPAVNLLTKDTTVEMSWQSVAEAENYEIQISQTAKFADLVESSVQVGTTYTSESLPDGRYYWRVRTLNSYDAPGSWSAVRSFTVDTLPLTVPILASPLQGTMVNTFTPKLSVKTVSGAKSYQFQVFPTDSPDDVWVEATVNTPTYTLTSAQALKFGSFSWRARTIDAAGNESDWSQPVSFIVRLQKSPLPASYTKVANTTFTWAAFPGATGFRVKICEDEAMETGCRSSADLTAATLKYVLPTPLPDGIYYWQIEVLGTALENPFTPVLSFTKVH